MAVGDVIGRPGRRIFRELTPVLKKQEHIDVVIVNGENAAGGKGLTKAAFDELLSGGADIVTGGNHIFDKREVSEIIDREPFLLRPANYPEGVAGKGFCVYPYRAKNIGVINLSGRVFMPTLDCPFRRGTELARNLAAECDIIIVDFHAEATSEKFALAFHLDGKINALVGTHTHVQTADERILPKGTAFISDLGMTGPWHSVIGTQTECVMPKFTLALPTKFEVAKGECVYSAAITEIDDATNKTLSIRRVLIKDEQMPPPLTKIG